jgi:hypothetical protein
MSSMTVRRGVVASLGGAAGALAAAAFVSSAPIASADDGNNSGLDVANAAANSAPAVTFPELTYENTFTVYDGSTETEYITDYTGSGSPTTTTDVIPLAAGDTAYGSSDSYSWDYFTSASAGYDGSGGYELYDLSTAAGMSDVFLPFDSVFSSFS